MQVTEALLDKLCDLARLKLEGDARAELKNDLYRMLEMVEQINELDTEGVAPLIHLTDEVNHYSQDEPQPAIPRSVALNNAPAHDSEYFHVPKVLSGQDEG